MILSEGGPTVIGQLLDLHLLEDLFLTISPVVMGRTSSDARLGLGEGVDLLNKDLSAEVLSVHRHRSHLFLRYSVAFVSRNEGCGVSREPIYEDRVSNGRNKPHAVLITGGTGTLAPR
jgi:hypothetical protein